MSYSTFENTPVLFSVILIVFTLFVLHEAAAERATAVREKTSYKYGGPLTFLAVAMFTVTLHAITAVIIGKEYVLNMSALEQLTALCTTYAVFLPLCFFAVRRWALRCPDMKEWM